MSEGALKKLCIEEKDGQCPSKVDEPADEQKGEGRAPDPSESTDGDFLVLLFFLSSFLQNWAANLEVKS